MCVVKRFKYSNPSRLPCYVFCICLLTYTNENPNTNKLSWAINYSDPGLWVWSIRPCVPHWLTDGSTLSTHLFHFCFFSSENDQILWALLFLYFPLITFFKTRSPIWEEEKMYCLSFTAKNGPGKKREKSDENMFVLMRRKSFGKHCHQNRKERPNDQKQSKNQKLLKCLHHQYISFLGVLSLLIILWWSLRHCKPFQPNQKHRQVWKWQICFVLSKFWRDW